MEDLTAGFGRAVAWLSALCISRLKGVHALSTLTGPANTRLALDGQHLTSFRKNSRRPKAGRQVIDSATARNFGRAVIDSGGLYSLTAFFLIASERGKAWWCRMRLRHDRRASGVGRFFLPQISRSFGVSCLRISSLVRSLKFRSPTNPKTRLSRSEYGPSFFLPGLLRFVGVACGVEEVEPGSAVAAADRM